MIQNAQMHQMIMQQLMLSSLSRPPAVPPPPASASAAGATLENGDPLLTASDVKELIDVSDYYVPRPTVGGIKRSCDPSVRPSVCLSIGPVI